MALQSRRQFLRGSLALGGLGLLAGCGRLPFQAQSASGGAKVARIGWLGPGNAAAAAGYVEAFRAGLGDLGNVTGSTFFLPELMGKRLELLKEVVPSMTRAAVLLNPDNAANTTVLQGMETTAKALRVELQLLTAQALGLAIPQSVLMQATDVIQ